MTWRAAILLDDNFRARSQKWLKKLEEREIKMERRPYLHICFEPFPVLLPSLSAQAVKDLGGASAEDQAHLQCWLSTGQGLSDGLRRTGAVFPCLLLGNVTWQG